MFGPLIPLLFSFVLLPLLVVLLHVQAVSLAFANLGLTPTSVIIIFYLSLLGGFVNIPISRRRIRVEGKSWLPLPFPFPLFYYPPRVREQVLAVNVGGAVIPILLSLYVLPNAPLTKVLLATAAVSAVCFVIARPQEGVGITIPAFIPPIVAALTRLLAGFRSGGTHGGGVYLGRHGHADRRRPSQLTAHPPAGSARRQHWRGRGL